MCDSEQLVFGTVILIQIKVKKKKKKKRPSSAGIVDRLWITDQTTGYQNHPSSPKEWGLSEWKFAISIEM